MVPHTPTDLFVSLQPPASLFPAHRRGRKKEKKKPNPIITPSDATISTPLNLNITVLEGYIHVTTIGPFRWKREAADIKSKHPDCSVAGPFPRKTIIPECDQSVGGRVEARSLSAMLAGNATGRRRKMSHWMRGWPCLK